MVEFRPVRPEERTRLWNLFQKFLYEMTNYYDNPIDEDGNIQYGWFDSYFEDSGRLALFLESEGQTVGFALLNRHSHLGEELDHALAEFTIFPAFRRRGLGLEAARALFTRWPGRWEVKYHEKNAAARTLWTTAAAPWRPRTTPYAEFETVLSFRTSPEGDRMEEDP